MSRLSARPPRFLSLVPLFCLLAATVAFAADEESETPEPRSIAIRSWLQLGPEQTPLPAFHEADEQGYAVKDLLDEGALRPEILAPRAGESVRWPLAGELKWKTTGDEVDLGHRGPHPAQAWLAIHVATDRWTKATVKLRGHHLLKAYLDGDAVDLGKEDAEEEGAAPTHSGELKLEIGKHLLLVHAVCDPAQEEDWTLSGAVEVDADLPDDAVAVSTDPTRAVDIRDVLHAPRIDGASISPDGKLVAVRLRMRTPEGENRRWTEIRSTRNGSLARTWMGDASGLQWAPDGNRLSYTTAHDEKTTVWLYDLESGGAVELAGGIEHFERYAWAPDGSYLIYSFGVEAKPDERKVKRVRNPADRQPWWRNRSYLVQVAVPGGASRRLTAGPLTADGWQISRDGKRLLFSQGDQDLTARPYFSSELWELDLDAMAVSQVLTDRWIGGAAYGPDPDVLALQGSPSAFDGLGSVLPEGVQPNDYGGQLYLYDRSTGTPTAVSRDHRPDIRGMTWSTADDLIYARCGETQYNNLYRFDPGRKTWTRIETGLESTSGFDLARDARVAVAWGTSVTTPNRLYAIDLKENEARLLLDPGADWYRDITFGEVHEWAFRMADGDLIDGFYYLPPGFDRSKKHPLIVYYYGGTSPITRDFGGRYPKNIWAGQGYVVYVPNPSGATGYGQEFAARHVNDWGERTVAEVIEGTKQFLAAHDFCDPEAVGCLGASYGGFMTMSLVTHTDIFAAAVSHAGISDISSYWGEGYWGYAYGARALANSFPWQNPEIYVDRSPLFRADKITTPLLMVHGDADTNVPPGESIQLFTALKLLGREAELVEIAGQNHWIVDHDQRIVWNDTILAWFAKHLKGRSGWWEELYPDAKPEKAD